MDACVSCVPHHNRCNSNNQLLLGHELTVKVQPPEAPPSAHHGRSVGSGHGRPDHFAQPC